MTLSFSSHYPSGEPAYFPEKILKSFPARWPKNVAPNRYSELDGLRTTWNVWKRKLSHVSYQPTRGLVAEPKLHTLRQDTKKRWKAGVKIHFVLFNRTPERWQFAEAKCNAVQEVVIRRYGLTYGVWVDGRSLSEKETAQLAKNDGFKTADDFYHWFVPGLCQTWSGRIIHWTDLKY